MGFTKIDLESYLVLHIKNNADEDKAKLKRRLEVALKDFQNGVKCQCGNDIWVIGSASTWNSCFTCLTGESIPNDDYELEAALPKQSNNKGQKHIDEMHPSEIHGFFSDDGYEINQDLIQKPSLCITCVHNDDPQEELFCNMTRYDQKDKDEFTCFAYKKIGS